MTRKPHSVSPLQTAVDLYEYNLNVVSIKMMVKFPCKMKLEHNSVSLTSEIQSNDSNIFIFNEDITIRENMQKQFFDVTVNILSDKGAKYIAGTIKLYHNQLIRSKGERIVVALGKCIDTEAVCQLNVDRVSVPKVNSRKTANHKQMVNFDNMPEFQQNEHSPHNHQGRNSTFFNEKGKRGAVAETKSEFQFPVNNNIRSRHAGQWDNKSREMPLSFYQRNTSKSPNNTRSNFNRTGLVRPSKYRADVRQRVTTQIYDQMGLDEAAGRDKLIEAEVYKQGYLKLKEKYKKQTQNAKNQLNKRIALQNSENSLKLEIMRYKLRSQQQEKILTDKNIKLKQLQTQVGTIQQKDLSITYLKQSIDEKQSSIRMYETTIQQLTRQNEQLKVLNSTKYTQQLQKIRQLEKQIDNLKSKFQIKQAELERQIKTKSEALNRKENELVAKTDLLDREKKSMQELQRTLTAKSNDWERATLHEKNLAQTRIQELKNKIDKLEREFTNLETEFKQSKRTVQHNKTQMMKLQYDKRILQQQNDSIRTQNVELKGFKQKYSEVYRQHRYIINEKFQLQKQLEQIAHSKETNINQMNRQYQDQIQYYKRVNRELDDRSNSFSNKIIQMEGQMQVIKSQSEKVRRNNENLAKDLAEAREKEKSSKKAIKAKQQQVISLEAEYSATQQKLKNIEQIHKLEEDKMKDQLEKMKYDLQNEYIRNNQLTQNNTELAIQHSKIKIKLQYTQERLDKDSSNLHERQHQLQNLIKDYEQQIDTLESNLNDSRQTEKEHSNRAQKLQIELVKAEQLAERTSKHLKVLEQKYQSVENACRTKTNEANNLQYDKEQLEKKIQEYEKDLSQIKNQISTLKGEKSKQSKISQMLEQDIKRSKIDIDKKKESLIQREKVIQQLRNEIKQLTASLTKSDSKYTSFKKQTDRFRQSLIEGLNSSFLPLLNPYINSSNDSTKQVVSSTKQLHLKSILGNLSSDLSLTQKKNLTLQSTSSTAASSNTQIISAIISHSKDIKLLMGRLAQQNKHLHKQTERLSEQASNSLNKHQTSEHQLHKTIRQLEEEISKILNQKEQDNIKNDHEVSQLTTDLKQCQNVINDQNIQIQEMQFTIESLKTEYDAAIEQNNKKLNNLKIQANQLQQKNSQMQTFNMELEDVIAKLQKDLDNRQQELESEKANILKKDLIIQEISQNLVKSQTNIDKSKHSRKELQQKISQLELHLSTETELKNKVQQRLTQEQAKSNEYKLFISNLMKQKQTAIKSELQKSEKITSLQTSNIQLQRDLQISNEEILRIKGVYEEQKQQLKKVSAKLKAAQNIGNSQSAAKTKATERLKEKEKQIINLTQTLKKMESKHEKLVEKIKSEMAQLQAQLDQKSHQAGQYSREINEKILSYEKLIQEKQNKILVLDNKLIQLEEQNYHLNEQLNASKDEKKLKQTQISELQAQLKVQKQNMEAMLQEIKQKQESMFELSGKIYNFEQIIRTGEAEKNQGLQSLDAEWIEKYQNVCDEYEQRLGLIEKQRDYFKGIISQRDQQIKKLRQDGRNSEIEDSQARRSLQDKIKKLEQDRLSLFTVKNNEIQRLTQQNKSQFDQIKGKQTDYRRISNQLQIARSTITALDQKVKDYDDKIKGINKVYSTELQQLKKKETNYKQYKQWVSNQQWSMERDVRKVVQNFAKKFIQNTEERASSKIVEMVKNLQGLVIQAISNRMIFDAEQR